MKQKITIVVLGLLATLSVTANDLVESNNQEQNILVDENLSKGFYAGVGYGISAIKTL